MDLYQGLLGSKEEKNMADIAEHEPLHYEKNLLKKIKRKKIKDPSAKNVLYNQQLRRYLRKRKEVKNRPIKVQLSDDPQNIKIIKAGNDSKEPVQVAAPDENEELQRVNIEENDPSVSFATSNAEELFNTPQGHSSNRSIESTPKNTQTSTSNTSIGKRTRAVRLDSEVKRQIHDLKFERLLEIINRNPTKFGVKDGKILNPSTGKPVIKSNLDWAIKRLISPTSQNAPSPVGLKYLHRSLLADDEASQFLHDKYMQKGEGRKKKTNSFRPAIWKK